MQVNALACKSAPWLGQGEEKLLDNDEEFYELIHKQESEAAACPLAASLLIRGSHKKTQHCQGLNQSGLTHSGSGRGDWDHILNFHKVVFATSEDVTTALFKPLLRFEFKTG